MAVKEKELADNKVKLEQLRVQRDIAHDELVKVIFSGPNFSNNVGNDLSEALDKMAFFQM